MAGFIIRVTSSNYIVYTVSYTCTSIMIHVPNFKGTIANKLWALAGIWHCIHTILLTILVPQKD